jgi:glycosyltransferase involved in cell wall biosynthesis
MQKNLSVKIIAPIFSINVFGEQARQIALALSEIGINVAIHDTTAQGDFGTRLSKSMTSKLNALKQAQITKPYVAIHIGSPERMAFSDNEAKANIAWTAVDANELPMLSAVLLENPNIKEVWLPSHWQKSIFDAHKGLEKKTSVVSWGVDYKALSEYSEKFDSLRKEGDFYFGFVGSMKAGTGADMLLAAFYDEFKNEPNVKLLMKCFMGNLDQEKEKEMMNKTLTQMKKDSKAQVIYIAGNQPDSVIQKTIKTADCMVFPSRAKAWNTNVLRSMALGVPVITNKHTGNKAYTNDTNVIGLSSRNMVIRNPLWLSENPLYQSCSWFEPNYEELKRAMRAAYTNGANADQIKNAKNKAAKMDWENVAVDVVKNIKKFEV